jgi:signal transduction histidine kinase
LLSDNFSGNPSLQAPKFASNTQVFRNALKNTPLTVFILDKNLCYTKIYNPTIAQPARQFVGKKVGEFSKPKDASALINFYQEVLKNGEAKQSEITLEFEEEKVIYAIYALPLKNGSGEVTGIAAVFTDVTQSRKMRSRLAENTRLLAVYANQMEKLAGERAKQLSQAERLVAIGQTAGMVGHDIRNPLQAIAGELFLAKDELGSMPDNEAKRNILESLASIESNLFYIDKIVADLQDYNKPLNPVRERIDVEKAIEEALLIVSIPSNLQVSISIEEGFPQISCDLAMLKRVLINLIQNAVQAMPNGGILDINAKYIGDRGYVSITDTGEGIPEEIKSKLFTPLFTTKSKGQGFGLAVVKRLVEAQDGEVTFESEKGRGTTFTIQLPLTQVPL